MPKTLKWNKKPLLNDFLRIVGLKNRQIIRNFDDIFVGCQMIFDEK
jgi:hypothetical protein